MTAILPVPNQTDIYTALRAFLLGILPTGMPVLRGQVNRVPEPHASDFVIMWTTRQQRIETNVDTAVDSLFTASIAGTVMTVTGITLGEITVGNQLFGTGLVGGTGVTRVTAQTAGEAGGTGTYTIGPTQNMSSSSLSAGAKAVLQPSEIVVQIDVHGPNSADNAQTITTLFRDEYATQSFTDSGYDVAPLYADDPKQIPFINAEQQYEDRWIVEAHLQANQVVNVPQQFADAVEIEVISVEATFPP